MICFAAHTAVETSNAFKWAKHPRKLPLLMQDPGPSNTWFLGPTQVSP